MPCILSSWLRSLRHGDKRLSRVKPSLYFPAQRDRIASMLEDGSKLVVASFADNPDLILGWACGRTGRLDYVYTKQAYRNVGIARLLVEDLCGHGPLRYTQLMDRVHAPAGWEYEPR